MPHFSTIDVSGKHTFRAALTDGGICQVLNGKSLGETYSSAQKADILKKTLDARIDEVVPDMIQGTGMLFRKKFWLDVGER